ncbi:Hypothetical_protein [Hexamita inflata]|uniref:Hypothetical_protein n=1 Tax=Hexamita inflata TaxID=28002 RepID=A0AA86UT58_9EUKA|nr:Hypothetical protein HINF_LOCUS51497 [Hexamita inflata]
MAILVLKNLMIIIGRILSVSSTQELILFQFTVSIRNQQHEKRPAILMYQRPRNTNNKETLDLILYQNLMFFILDYSIILVEFDDCRLESTTKLLDPRFGTYRRHAFLKYQT